MTLLTPQQSATLKTDIEADPVLSLLTVGSDSASIIAEAYKLFPLVDFYVFRTDVKKDEIQNCIIYDNMTPMQAVPTSTQLAVDIWAARCLLAQSKQFNLQNLLLGVESFNFSLPNIRKGFQDALTVLPTKSDGTNQNAGWTTLQAIIYRKANRLEKLLATGDGTTALPATMSVEGSLTYSEIAIVLNWSI